MLPPLLALLGFTPLPTPLARPHASARGVAMSLTESLNAWQFPTLAKLVDGLALQPKSYAADMGFDSFTVGAGSGQIISFEAPGKSNVAWCSALSLSDGSANARSSISAWCGPLSDVPHLTCCAAMADGYISLCIDFLPRAECAYNPTGEYEEPASREAFAMSGNRKDFASAFFTDDMVAWRQSLLSLDGAVHTPLSAEQMAVLSAGPLYLDLKMPASDANAAAAAKACEDACTTWLRWMQTSTEAKRDLPAGAKQTQIYARDTKIKANVYGSLLAKYTAAYGDLGKSLAAADAGPLDEAYVGGAS